MLRVQQQYFDVLDAVAAPEQPAGRAELGGILQKTLQLEHATIPPYLTAAYSLRGNANRAVRDLVLRIAKEEMLHMTVIANLMNAIDVAPRLNDPSFIPKYPDALPLLEVGDWKIELRPFSSEKAASEKLVRDVFMRIESPEKPNHYPDDLMPALDGAIDLNAPKTIGALYQRIIEIIEQEKVPGLFDGAAAREHRQVTADFLRMSFPPVQVERSGPPRDYRLPPDIDFRIVDARSAARHLRWIVDQGEGTDKQPLDAKGLPAHYYRFESIVYEEYLVKDPHFAGDAHYDGGYAFSGAPLVLDLRNVHEFDLAPDVSTYSGELLDAMTGFRETYLEMLALLDTAFNCPDATEDSLQVKKQAYRDSRSRMIDLGSQVSRIIQAAGEGPQRGALLF